MILPNLETYIFDLDGVLIDSLEDLSDSVNHTLNAFGKESKSSDEIRKYIGKGNKALIMRAFDTYDDPFVQEALLFFMDHYQKNCVNKTVLRKDVPVYLNTIRDKNLAILSNKFSLLTEIIIKELGILDRFQIFLGPDNLTNMKPDPEGINNIIERFDSTVSKTIIFGDSASDIYTGKNAGIITCGVQNGIGDETELLRSEPDYMITEFSDLV